MKSAILFSLCLITASAAIVPLSAQRRGNRGGAGRSGSATPGDTESPEAKEFERAAAIQARPEQVTAFQQMTKADDAALQSARELLQQSAGAGEIDLFHYAKTLNDRTDEAQFDNQQFVLSFSKAQKSGLKELTKKLNKAVGTVAKNKKALSHELEQSKVDRKRIAAAAGKLDSALAELQSRQEAVGSEMGILAEGTR